MFKYIYRYSSRSTEKVNLALVIYHNIDSTYLRVTQTAFDQLEVFQDRFVLNTISLVTLEEKREINSKRETRIAIVKYH